MTDQWKNRKIRPIKMMRAVRVLKQGEKPILDKIPIPKVSSGKLLIKNVFSGVNYIDTYHLSGLYPIPTPFTLGVDGAGIIEDVGDNVTLFKKGQRVTFYVTCLGADAEYTLCDEKDAIAVPDSIPLDIATACMVQGMTAHYLSHDTHKVKQGDVVLIHACVGGTGSLLVQLCKALGAIVIGTVGSDEKVKIAKNLGVDHVINYNTHDFVEQVAIITKGSLCNVVYDGVGKATWEGSLKCVTRRGLAITFGNASGKIPDIDSFLLSKYGSIFVTRPKLGDYVVERAEYEKRAHDLFQYIQEGKLRVEIHKSFPLEKVEDALAEIQNRATRGKILLKCGNE